MTRTYPFPTHVTCCIDEAQLPRAPPSSRAVSPTLALTCSKKFIQLTLGHSLPVSQTGYRYLFAGTLPYLAFLIFPAKALPCSF